MKKILVMPILLVMLVGMAWGIYLSGSLKTALGNKTRKALELAGENYAGVQDFIGKITWIDLEGGFPGFIADDSSKYYLVGEAAKALKAEAGKNERKIRLQGERKKEVVTIYMWGEPLEVISYEWMD